MTSELSQISGFFGTSDTDLIIKACTGGKLSRCLAFITLICNSIIFFLGNSINSFLLLGLNALSRNIGKVNFDNERITNYSVLLLKTCA
mgnify:CR=1 FL=1